METNTLSFFTNDLHLRQSELFGNDYREIENQTINTFSDIAISNLEDWQNSILQKNQFLNELQINNVQKFFISLAKVLETINPDKLKINDDSIAEENELLLWRETTKGISKLIFNEYGQIIYVFNGNDGKKVRGVFDNNIDFEKLLYRFL